MQRLRVPEHGGHGLNAGADYVVKGVLLCQTPTGGLRVRSQSERFWILRVELFHQFGPQHPGCPQLRYLHEIVHADAPEKGDSRGKVVDVDARLQPGAHVLEAVRKSVGHFKICRSTGLLHVVAGYADTVELRHVARRESKNIRDDAHGSRGRVDVGVAYHVLF